MSLLGVPSRPFPAILTSPTCPVTRPSAFICATDWNQKTPLLWEIRLQTQVVHITNIEFGFNSVSNETDLGIHFSSKKYLTYQIKQNVPKEKCNIRVRPQQVHVPGREGAEPCQTRVSAHGDRSSPAYLANLGQSWCGQFGATDMGQIDLGPASIGP